MKCIGCKKTLQRDDIWICFLKEVEMSKNISNIWFEIRCDCGMQNEINYKITDVNGLEPVFAPEKDYA